MQSILNSLSGSLDSLAKQVEGTLSGPLNSVGTLIENEVIKPIAGAVNGALGIITNAADNIGGAIETGLSSTLKSVSSGISSVVGSAEQGFSTAIQGVTGALSSVESSLVQQFNGIVTGVERGFGAISSAIGSAVATVGQDIGSAITTLGGEIARAVTDVITPIGTFLEQLPSDIATIAEKVVTGIEDLGATLESYAKDVVDFGARVTRQVEASKIIPDILSFVEQTAQNFPAALDSVFAKISGLDVASLEAGTVPRIALAQELMSVVMLYSEFLPNSQWYAGYALAAIQEAMLHGSYRNLRQASNAGTPNELLAVGDLVNARYKSYLADDAYYAQMKMHGFSKENADLLFQQADVLLNVGELVSLYYRGVIHSKEELYALGGQIRASKTQMDDLVTLYEKLLGVEDAITLWRRDIVPDGWTDAFDDARRAGFTPERLAALQQASYRIPTPAEQKRFAIRKVDDPATVEKYQYDYGLNDAYIAAAKANGYDEDNAKRFYRDSWAIPPFFITESLYRSGLLDRETFQQFLEIEGYTPYFADKLISQLAPKLTQGDIKDMYKYQVITADAIVPKLATIGITGDLADELSQLWQASVKLASPLDANGASASAQRVKDDTGTLIKTAYKDGILSRDDALAKLKAIEYTDDAATLTLDIVDYETEQAGIKAMFETVKAQYLARSIALSDALTALQAVGANPTQMVLYQAELEKATTTKTRTPTLAEFSAWYKKGIISLDELGSALSMLGYADVWLPFFMLADGAQLADVQALGLDTTNVLQSS